MGGGEVPKGAVGGSKSPTPSLAAQTLCEYMKIPATQTKVTIMAKIRAVAQQDENRRAPITICAAIDRRCTHTHTHTHKWVELIKA